MMYRALKGLLPFNGGGFVLGVCGRPYMGKGSSFFSADPSPEQDFLFFSRKDGIYTLNELKCLCT